MSATRRELVLGAGAAAGLAACGGGSRIAGPFRPAPRCKEACTTVDAHCHVFNASDLPVAAFVSSVAPVPDRLIRRLLDYFEARLDAPTAAEELAALAPVFAGRPIAARSTLAADTADAVLGAIGVPIGPRGASAVAAARRLAVLLDFVLRSRAEIASAMVAAYPTVDLFTPCMVDFDGWAQGVTASPLPAQIRVQERIAKLSIRGRIGHAGARIHPFVAFNPLREVHKKIRTGDGDIAGYRPYGDDRVFAATARYVCGAPLAAPAGDWAVRTGAPPEQAGGVELVRHAVEVAGFLGVKLYPPTGFVPLGNAEFQPVEADADLGAHLDLAMRAFYAYAEAEQVPITTHCSESNGYRLGFGDLASPAGWASVLAEFPALRLNLGHFGHLGGLDDERGPAACEAWMRQIAVLMQRYPNVYADISYSDIPIADGFAAIYLDHLEKLFERFPRARLRLMYGSDWWLNRLSANAELHVDACHQVFEERFGAALRADVMGTNALRFLGLVDDRGVKIASRSRQRLQAFYGEEKMPAWLVG